MPKPSQPAFSPFSPSAIPDEWNFSLPVYLGVAIVSGSTAWSGDYTT